MNVKHYNNVIDWTLKHDKAAQTDDSLATARAVFKNMGVALPNGSMQEVYETIKTNKYMGWRACTMEEAQEAANKGTAAIGISKDAVVILSATDEDEPVPATASVMTLSDNAVASAMAGMEYYAYSCGTTSRRPHGNYLSFSCIQPAVCNDGIGKGYDDPYHQSQTSYMNGVLNADIHRYIIIPQNVNGYASLRGCVGVAVRNDGTYVFGVVGDVGPTRNEGELDEFSVKMIKDLGFNTDGATYVTPADTVVTYIFPDTRRSSWPSDALNSEAEAVGKMYYY